MKKILLILALVVLVSLLVACEPYPTKPNEVLPFCQDKYEELRAGEYPDLPPAYVGGCVAYWQTGKYSAYAPLCSYDKFIEAVQTIDPSVATRQQCVEFLKTYND